MQPPSLYLPPIRTGGQSLKLRKLSVANVVPEFYMFTAPLLPRRAFNHEPQSGEFGLTSAGACIFLDNVDLEDLKLFRSGLQSLRLTIPRL